jgi:hypothetical protein
MTTVKELIEKLREFDQDLVVAFYDAEWANWIGVDLDLIEINKNRPVDYVKQEKFVGIQ